MENNQTKLKGALDHPFYYARDINTLSKESGLSLDDLRDAAEKSEDINSFTHKDIEYMGLKSRKPVYDADARRGINPYEANYKGDEYRNKMLGGKPRFPSSASE